MPTPGQRASRGSFCAHRRWLGNIERRAVAPQAVADIVRQHRITRDTFRVLDAMDEIGDPDGKTYFLLSRGVGGGEAADATLLTYLFNAGTGYGAADHDFPATPYSADEVRRIIARQRANRWSYETARAITATGGRLAATPNGMLIGVAGNRFHAQLSRRGGTTWGDVFLLNPDVRTDPVARLCEVIAAGRLGRDGPSLDRLLHHEERHAQQWARLGPVRMGTRYLMEEGRARIFGGHNRFERDAGLSDGGYA